MDPGTEPLASDMISSAYDNTDLETCTLSLAYCNSPLFFCFALVIQFLSGKAVICSVFTQDEAYKTSVISHFAAVVSMCLI